MAETPPSQTEQRGYAIQLLAIPASEDPGPQPALKLPPGSQLYWTSVEREGRSWRRLRLGDFPTLAAARATLALVAGEYPEAWIAPIRGPGDGLEPASQAASSGSAEASDGPLPPEAVPVPRPR